MFRVTKVPPGRYEPLAALRFGAWPASTAVGSTSGPDPVLLVHGQPGRASVWRQVGDEPARRGVHALALDRPGYGRSHRPAVGFAGNAVAVVDFLDYHGIDRVTVVAHNLASGAAIALAIAFPERVTSMVLLAPVGATSSVNRLGRLLAWPIIGWGALRGGLRPGAWLMDRDLTDAGCRPASAISSRWRPSGQPALLDPRRLAAALRSSSGPSSPNSRCCATRCIISMCRRW